MNIIHVEDLTASYGDKPVLWDVDVDVERNSVTAIVGPNGAGKSTLMKCILGFVRPLAGKILIDGKTLPEVRRRIAYVPQKSSVNWDFPITVQDVILMGRYPHLGWIRRPRAIDRQAAYDAMEEMEMTAYRDRQISQLSGGQKQRVFIARALCQDADLLMMDEPLAGVDQTSEKIIMKKVRQLQGEGKTIVCIHHDLNTLREYFDHIVLINRHVIAQGPIAQALTERSLNQTYQEANYNA
ncbi:ATPase component of Mn/Zn ABC-type transporter [Jonquetella anthropi DSM 22815]|uniref:ATPase component of Mn/Zn ABC-type transporter n=1 Tax=Jonquetella anthropi DSM 22815 TaxID=885272 RepID=H0UIG6_9BACT|nr:metal ABC transporter ATP-binding protein [Jonquetella anthropi]EEX47719.1 ABC transporter, ATP-binding protein [Jonquetella anthropi E3_33 E1]EHM12674.1 ATPase component of Mn/Zn ABC-type transporter [Jonquetella anthropi DSM 22815]